MSEQRRSLRTAPTPRTFYSPEATPQRHNPPRAAASHSHASGTNNTGSQGSNGVNGTGGTAHFPTFQTPAANLPVGRPVLTPRTAPEKFVSPLPEAQPGTQQYPYGQPVQKFGVGHNGSTMMNRIIMGLKSGMSTEVDYSLSQLVKISFEAGDELRSDIFPGLSIMLFDILRTLPELVKTHGHTDSVDHKHYTHALEKIIEAALILRNMSIVQENALEFATSPTHKFKALAAEILTLADHSNLVEVKCYVLDMVECLASYFPNVSQNDPLFDWLVTGLASDDRGQLLGSLRAIVRMLMGRDEYNQISEVPIASVERMTSLLMLEDEELVSACLDFLYQYTTNEENVARLLSMPWGFSTVKQLVRLLCFHGITGEQLVYVKSQRRPKKPVPEIPVLPPDIVNELLTYPEPDRATKWMRCTFTDSPEHDITQIALWQAYQSRFNDFAPQHPLLPAAEFIKNVSVAFASASAMVIPANPQTGTQPKFIIKGIRPREVPVDTRGKEYVRCRWDTCLSNIKDTRELWHHILLQHIGVDPQSGAAIKSGDERDREERERLQQQLPPQLGPDGQPLPLPPLPPPPPTPAIDIPTDPSLTAVPLRCKYYACRYSATHPPFTTPMEMAFHVRTHLPSANSYLHSLPKEEQEMMADPFGRIIIQRCQTSTDEKGEAVGIPLTSVLVLRNIRRRGGGMGKMVLADCRERLGEVMCLNKTLAGYVTELVCDDE
ncbi:hypothetical protein EX30DRAFT_392334 [Ascodesmis nigricans]|uniref:RFX-type winged-helix domain-containing protein n=1 Tax=Ascodesmis nigricans TaxID=341454 RepID=A0A4S2N736_9PEZI|nr:hypothetical protein EX30DRAFT_392334 [Ascodesmis nigricans]